MSYQTRIRPFGTITQGVDFDGTDDRIQIGVYDNILTENSPLTISVWITPDTDHDGSILGKREPSGGGNVNFRVVASTARSIRLTVFGSTALVRTSSANTVDLGVRQNYVVTWDGSTTAANVHIYKNGTEVGYSSTTNGVGIVSVTGGTIQIGELFDALQRFNGRIAELAYWKSVIPITAIPRLSKPYKGTPLLISPATLHGYWPLDDYGPRYSVSGRKFLNLARNTYHGKASGGSSIKTWSGANYPLAYSIARTRRRYRNQTAAASATGIMTPRSGYWGDL